MTVIPGPFSLAGKEAAVQKEVKEHYEAYFARAARTRMWFADRLRDKDEMARYGHLISDDTKEILLGFLGVESFVDDYVFCGINAAGDNVSTRGLYIQWGFEERRHGQVFRNVLIDSGLYTQEFVDKYLAEAAEYRWSFEAQTGYEEEPLLSAAYAMFQERQTRWNYTHTRMLIWNEYGSPTDATGRNIAPAIAGAIRFPEMDEGAHEANFANIVRIHLKYFPERTLDALVKVTNHYRMPIVQLPHAEEFVRCILAAGMGEARHVINEIMTPVLERMGFANRQALRRAVTNFRLLPENAVVHVQGKPLDGIVPDADTRVYGMLPSGEFILETPASQD